MGGRRGGFLIAVHRAYTAALLLFLIAVIVLPSAQAGAEPVAADIGDPAVQHESLTASDEHFFDKPQDIHAGTASTAPSSPSSTSESLQATAEGPLNKGWDARAVTWNRLALLAMLALVLCVAVINWRRARNAAADA